MAWWNWALTLWAAGATVAVVYLGWALSMRVEWQEKHLRESEDLGMSSIWRPEGLPVMGCARFSHVVRGEAGDVHGDRCVTHARLPIATTRYVDG